MIYSLRKTYFYDFSTVFRNKVNIVSGGNRRKGIFSALPDYQRMRKMH
jgi:hypothetical protein